jgi:predicted transcriptional regulator
MANSAVVTIRLKPEVMEKLDSLARDTRRSTSDLASEAIERYVDLNSWQIAHIKEGLTEDEAGNPGVSQEQVRQWIESWGTDRELPRPQPKNS